jgi:hypothetical protein
MMAGLRRSVVPSSDSVAGFAMLAWGADYQSARWIPNQGMVVADRGF